MCVNDMNLWRGILLKEKNDYLFGEIPTDM